MSSLAKKAVSGILWTTGFNVFRDVLQFGLMLALVRLLAPAVYGQFGLVTSILGFLSVFSLRVFVEHTLQIRPGGEVDYQLYFTVSVVLQVILFVVANVAALVLKHVPTYAPVAPLLHVMSPLFLIDIASEFRSRMLEREMAWGRLRTLQAIGFAANAVASLAMAAAGFGVYALLVPVLLFALPAGLDLIFTVRWRPTWKWDAEAFRPALRYGLTRLVSCLVIWTRQLLESSYLVQIAGFTMYGIYGRALGLAAICCLKVPSLLTQALFPVLTRLEPGSDVSNRAGTLVLCSVAWTTFPAAVVFSVLASPVVHTLYGQRWNAAIPFVPWAMAASTGIALTQAGTLLLVANLHQKRGSIIDIFNLAGTAIALWTLAPRGITLYLTGTCAVQTVAFLITLLWLHRTGAVSISGMVNSLVVPGCNAAVTYLAMEGISPYLPLSRHVLPGAILYGALFSTIYVVLLRLVSGRQCREVVRFLPGHNYLQRLLLLEA